MFVKFCIGLKKEFLENRRADGHNFRIGVNKITLTCVSCNCVILYTKERLCNVKNMPLSTPFINFSLGGSGCDCSTDMETQFNEVSANSQNVRVI